ncbi:hypothetical protein [Effusibacillus lacus]|uniref:Xylose isomerase n=1 Tax=Effusibacillus lacus TaxID=1348429 RepID=A0A292YT82_9BACL|nr:hypothetical protein [Effusibacillus lacus]TCS75920.1 hypothetical protein EDD64_105102 [Effusibacillus lacus]GAX91690.1 xylose isomerase [Effusibacillus lacus]
MSDQVNPQYRFSFGPWNIHEGADPFGPPVRKPFDFRQKLAFYRELGVAGVQFHDDDIVPDIDHLSYEQVIMLAREVRLMLDDLGMETEMVAPRLWESPSTIDGAFTSNCKAERE